ncbi:hypothetical protein BD414DRAFT_492969 [Trametes punicea]|nr:hypothetical protein BD414DRAFT_492969 [Trametes punicea]
MDRRRSYVAILSGRRGLGKNDGPGKAPSLPTSQRHGCQRTDASLERPGKRRGQMERTACGTLPPIPNCVWRRSLKLPRAIGAKRSSVLGGCLDKRIPNCCRRD